VGREERLERIFHQSLGYAQIPRQARQ
jgi:hypothetical protein